MKFTIRLLILFSAASVSHQLSAQSLEEARRLTLNQQYDAASSQFKQLIGKNPGKGDYWFYFGRNVLEAEKTDSAKALFIQGVQNEPNNPLNYAGIGIVAKISGAQEESAQMFEKAIKTAGGKNAEVLIRIAEAHISIEKKNIPAAFALLQEAEKLDFRNPEIQILNGDAYLENNDGSSAIRYYEKAQSLDPKSPLAILRIGQLWMRARNYSGKDGNKGALEYYKDAIQIDPNFAPAYAELGELFARAQRYQEAKDYYAKYLELSASNLYARIRYASFLFLTKEYPQTLNQIKEVWQSDTTRNLLNRLAAYASYETKDYQNGLIYINKFFARQPESKLLPSDYAYYGKLLSASGQDSLAVEKLKVAISKDSSQVDLFSDLAGIYAKMKKHDLAVMAYQQKIRAGKAITNDYYRMGQSYYNLKEFGKADTAFMKVTETQPKLTVGYLWRGRTNASLDPDGKQGLARPFYEQLIVLTEADPVKYRKELLESLEYLGAYFYLTGDFANSKIYWEKVKTLDPENEKAKVALEDMKGKK